MFPSILATIRTKLADLRHELWRYRRRWELLREQAAWRRRMKLAYADYLHVHQHWVEPRTSEMFVQQMGAAAWLRHCQREVWLRREALRILA